MTSRRKRGKENLMWRRQYPDCAPPNKNAASTVWLYETRAINGIAYCVYTARPKGGHLNRATRLTRAIENREEKIHSLIRWQQERNNEQKGKDSGNS